MSNLFGVSLADALDPGKGIYFLKNGKVVQLSSGQRLFSYIVINIIGAIRRNSLVLIDEPELFLHPTLEIAFIGMLKKLLASYRSKALLATHSLVTVRELPRSCVHVFEKRDDEVFINHPPFETFGGDMQRISSYVFGDKSVSKPFETWIRQKLSEFDSAESLIEGRSEVTLYFRSTSALAAFESGPSIKIDQVTRSVLRFWPPRAPRSSHFPHYRCTCPAVVSKCRRAIHRFDSANSVTS